MSWTSVWDRVTEHVDIDIAVRSKGGGGQVDVTTSGTTGRPSIAGRLGDLQIEPVLLVAGGVAVILWALK